MMRSIKLLAMLLSMICTAYAVTTPKCPEAQIIAQQHLSGHVYSDSTHVLPTKISWFATGRDFITHENDQAYSWEFEIAYIDAPSAKVAFDKANAAISRFSGSNPLVYEEDYKGLSDTTMYCDYKITVDSSPDAVLTAASHYSSDHLDHLNSTGSLHRKVR